MGNLEELELTRRGFTVLAASAFGAFLIKPKTAIGLSTSKTYIASVKQSDTDTFGKRNLKAPIGCTNQMR